ncbi:MAG: flagellar motor protein [Spirochaetes bacterium]|nr:flagellar motor protein [Spirochaetota bacterium]
MDLATIIGIALGFAGPIIGFLMEGGHFSGLFGTSAALIVFGGTIGATVASYSIKDIMKVPQLLIEAITLHADVQKELLEIFVTMSEKARRDGLLSLETDIEEGLAGAKYDPMLVKGLKLVVDGTEPELVRNMLNDEIYTFDEEKKKEALIFQTAGGYSPTLGIVGTVMGLIHVLGNLSSADSSKLGGSIALAFIATLYGISFANLVYLPISSKLKIKALQLKREKEFIIEGVLSIQAGHNPRIVREKLESLMVDHKPSKEAKKED